jgi:predicted dehydrogenase
METAMSSKSKSSSNPDRRAFIKKSAVTSMAVPLAARLAKAQDAERIPIAIIGTGGMGMNHVRLLARRADVDIAYVCDVDNNRLQNAMKEAEQISGRAPQGVTDLRKILDDQRVQAVFIATPDHWHAPAAILALNAGKHVYVEKPCCHNLREGQLLQEAVERSGKKLQVGTQSRSTEFVRAAIDKLREGAIGRVLVAKAWNSQRRGSIGHEEPTAPPPELDFDTWIGPARPVPYRKNLLHGVWRWWYDFGCGDIGNDGVHDIDVALWGLDVKTFPSRVTCLGGKLFFDDDQQFPDTQYTIADFADSSADRGTKQFIFEQRIWTPYVQEGYENGAAFYGTEGCLILGHSVGWKLYGPRNVLREERQGGGDLPAHHQNFLDAVRDNAQTTHADITVGRLAAGIVHLSNIAARLGRVIQYDLANHQILNDAEAISMMKREYREDHWSFPAGA